MTLAELAAKFSRNFTLRYFDLTPKPHSSRDQYPGPWRAAFSGHYMTSDTCRLVSLDDDNRGEEGWGATPEEAIDALVSALIETQRRRSQSNYQLASEADAELAKLLALRALPPEEVTP